MFYKSETSSTTVNSKAEVQPEIQDVTVITVNLSDTDFMTQYQVSPRELKPVDVRTLFATKVTPEMIEQKQIGNCYFLSALASMIRRDPDFLSKIFQITKEGKIAISFYDANDVSKKYVYIIDPTKVVKSQSNDHKHDVIFLLEKAYAIHRLTLEPTKYSDTQSAIRSAILKAGGLEAPVDMVLRLLSEEIDKKISKDMDAVDKFLKMDLGQLILETDIMAIAVMNELKKCNFDQAVAREKLLAWYTYSTTAFYRADIAVVKQKMVEEKRDYISALEQGFSDVVFRSLTGENAERRTIHHDNLRYFLEKFFLEIRNEEPKNCSPQVQATLIRMFGSLDSDQAQLFSQAIKSMERSRWKELQLYTMELLRMLERKEPIETSIHLLKIFSKFPNWQVGDPRLIANTMDSIQTYVQDNLPQKRGTGRYTPYQTEIYELIKQNLMNGAHINIATTTFGKDTKKGLVSDHAYEVVNCYKQGDLYYVLLRNPWAQYGREYQRKEKIVHDKKLSVLGTVDQTKLSNFKQRFLEVIGAREEIKDPAIPERIKLSEDGYFAVELTDIVKNFHSLYIGGAKRTPSQKLSV